MRSLAVALVGLTLACGSPTEPSTPVLSFTGQVIFGIPTLPTRAESQAGYIKITGVLQTPTSEFTLAGRLSAPGGRQLVLDIDAEKTQFGLPFPVQNYYEGFIRNLASGDYDLEVIHTLHSVQVQTTRVFQQRVRVP